MAKKPFETIVVDELTALTKSVTSMDKKMDLHIQSTQYELKAINQLDEQQNTILAEHVAGVNTLKDLLVSHEAKDQKMFETLAAPTRWLGATVKVAGGISVFAGLVYLILIIWSKYG